MKSDKLEQEQEIERLLAAHLERRLSGQLGRARLGFAREIARPRRGWAWLGAAAAVAAGLLIAWAILGRQPAPNDPSPGPRLVREGSPSILGAHPAVQAASWSPFQDAGTVVLQDRPMRSWTRTMVEELQYYDAGDKAMVTRRTPTQQVYFIGMQTD